MAISYGTYTITEVQEGSQIWTSSAAPTTPNYTFDVSKLVGDSETSIKSGDIIMHSYNRYTVLSVSSDGKTVLAGNLQSIRGATGAASVTYALIVSNLAIIKDKNGNLSPSTITVTAKSQTGSNAMANYTGRIKIETTTNNSTWTSRINEDAATKTYTIPSDTVAIRCSLYLKGGTTTLLDQQTVPVVSDGIDGINGTNGKDGVDGKDAYSIVLTNENHTFAGNTTSAIASEIECNVIAYKGTTQIAATIGTITGQPTGMTTSLLNNGMVNAAFRVSVTSSMVTKNGVLNVPITVDNKVFTKKFTYGLALDGEDGKDGGRWYSGTSITGTSTTATVFSGSGITSAVIGDMYLNTTTYNTYRCTLGGDASTAKWVYVNNIKGVHGDTGKGVSSIVNQYYLSTSNTTQTGGSWSTTVPPYVEDCYYWTKSHIVWTDNTETDTTAVLDNGLTDANANAINARKVATNYLSVDSTGIMVADMQDGEQLPSTATGRNVFIDNDSVDIRDGQRTLASFRGEDTKFYDVNSDNKEVASFGSNGVRVGNKDEQHFIVDAESIQAINENGSPIFSVTSTGGMITSDVVVAKGFNSQASDYDVILNGGISSSENTFYPKDLYAFITIQNSRSEFTSFEVSINDGEFEDVPFTRTSYTPEDSELVVRSRHHVDLPRFLFHYGTEEYMSYQLEGVYTSDKGNTYRYSGDIHISYDGQRTITMHRYQKHFYKMSGDAEDDIELDWWNGYLWGDIYSSLGYTKAPAMTFGTRGNGGTIAPLSVAIGQDLYANNENQLSIGKYNLQNNDGLAFVIGNGTDDANRSNAFTVNWDGNTEVGGDLKVANNAEIVNDISVGGDVNITGAIKSNNKPMFKVVNRVFTSIGIDSGRAYTTKRTISIDGYTPVSIGGIKVTNNMAYNASSYADASWCVVPAFWIDFSDTIDDPNIRTDALYFYIWNMNSSKGVVVDFNVRIIYIATDALGQ